ncbi:MAG: adenylyltransferase/cytidyltransferase family protein [Paludibacteraceae bacterium]|nr:adenylyltransferase/cytidyltransferase family protein [Paludibacteraceae bacterium]
MKTVAVSGGFDPVTPGHIEYFRMAKELGDKLIVIVNTDDFLKAKKGYAFMPLADRVAVLEAIKYVDKVVPCIDKDMTVAETIKFIKPDVFAKGGDRSLENLPEKEISACGFVNCEIVCGVGNKTHSSSWYTKNLKG